MALLDELVERVAAQTSVEASVELLVADLVQRIKATSNDQNIQRLSRDLRAVQGDIVRGIAAKQSPVLPT